MMSDKECWDALRKGDIKAYESIYRKHFSALYNYGKRWVVDQSNLEDCLQELFVEIWERRENLSSTNAIRPYLMVSLKRKLFRTVKKIRKSTDQELMETHFDVSLAIDDIMIQNEEDSERMKSFKLAFDGLPARQKEILYLKYHADLDYNSIGEIMDLNYQSARNLMNRAVQKLSKLLTSWVIFFFCKLLMSTKW